MPISGLKGGLEYGECLSVGIDDPKFPAYPGIECFLGQENPDSILLVKEYFQSQLQSPYLQLFHEAAISVVVKVVEISYGV